MNGQEIFKSILTAVITGVVAGVVIAHLNQTKVVKKLKPHTRKK